MKLFFSALFALLIVNLAAAKTRPGYLQITVYHYNTTQQEALIDEYLRDAFLPELHKMGVKNIGVFKPIANDTAKEKATYVVRLFKGIQQLAEVSNAMWDVSKFNGKAEGYLGSNPKMPAYSRMENMIINAFDMAPLLTLPKLSTPKSDHIYEFRSYEGASERLHNNKVKMFNEGGEVALFSRLNFNAVFYGKVIAGCKMPNLVYMTSFENRQDRDEHWKAFSADPEWKKLSSMPEYQNNVSKNETILMKAADYSDY